MKILAIRGQNLASLARSFAIDLCAGELAGAGIFAICGPVGAGKSTLLDALCLALFDRTPRLAGRGGVPIGEEGRPEGDWLHSHDPRTLLRRGAGEGFAEVDFTGRDGQRYRARWTVRRARRKPDGRMQMQEMTLRDLDRDVVVASANKTEVLGAIRARLGLDFAQFCRSVLLAQGEFAAFLRASSDERASLLESLTGADLYRRLSKAAHERHKLARQKVESLSEQTQVLPLLDADGRQQREQRVAVLARDLHVSQLGVDLAQGVVSWYRAAADRRQEEERAHAALIAAQSAEQAARPRRLRLTELGRALPLVPRAELIAERQRNVVQAIAGQKDAERAWDAATGQQQRAIAEQQAMLRHLLPGAVAGVPPIVTDFERWQASLSRWVRAQAQVAAIAASVDELQARAIATAAAHGRTDAALQATRRELEAGSFAGLGDRRRQLERERGELRQHAEALRAWQLRQQDADRIRLEVVQHESEREQLAHGFDDLLQASQAAEATLQQLRQQLDQVRARRDLHAFREHLVDGEACPLCGALEHPAPADGDDALVRSASAAVSAAEQVWQRARDEVRARELARARCEQELRRTQAVWQRAKEDLGLAVGSCRDVVGDVGITELEQAEALVGAAERRLAAREQDLAQLADRHEAALQKCRQAERQESAARLATEQARQQLQQGEAAAASLVAATEELEPAFAGVPDWRSRLQTVGDRVESVCSDLAAGERRRQQAALAATTAAQAVTTTGREVERVEAEFAAAKLALDAALQAARLTAVDVREAADLGAEAIAVEREQLAQVGVEVERARAVLAQCVAVRKKHDSRDRPAIDEDDAPRALEDAQQARKDIRTRLDAVRAELAADDLVRRQRDEIEPRLQAARAELEVWAALDGLIGHSNGDRFAVFAQSVTLDLLLIEANRRLRELAPRFQLKRNTSRDMDFVVVDLDLGGARRGLQTLSGGETFLVSLALALALATLAAPRSRVETLFLDEGFGTLDAQNLEAALGALDSLQATGCQIGMISHVDGIAERIGAVIDVVPEGGGQSRVRVRVG